MATPRVLIEREHALALLSRAHERAGAGGSTVLVAGEAGVGKTALVDTVAASSRWHDAIPSRLAVGGQPLLRNPVATPLIVRWMPRCTSSA